jgi:hypothetical protein
LPEKSGKILENPEKSGKIRKNQEKSGIYPAMNRIAGKIRLCQLLVFELTPYLVEPPITYRL